MTNAGWSETIGLAVNLATNTGSYRCRACAAAGIAREAAAEIRLQIRYRPLVLRVRDLSAVGSRGNQPLVSHRVAARHPAMSSWQRKVFQFASNFDARWRILLGSRPAEVDAGHRTSRRVTGTVRASFPAHIRSNFASYHPNP
jgi:hypothetical protein